MKSTEEPAAQSLKLDRETPKINQPNRLWSVVLALGLAFDLLFWKHPIGINFAMFLMACLAGGIYVLTAEQYRPSRNSLWLLIPFTFFVIATFLRKEPLTSFLAFTFSIVLIGMFANTYLGGRWFQYRLKDYVYRLFDFLNSAFSLQVSFFMRFRKEQRELGKPGHSFLNAAVLRGILMALPVVIFFTILLASADVVFEQKVADFFAIFNADKIFEYTLRLMIILLVAYLLAGAFLHAVSRSKDEKLLGEDGNRKKQILGFTESSIVLGSVAVLFLLFVIVQFRYFFGGQTNIGVAGYTYSQYARRGFNELVMVAFFSLLLIMGLGAITRREKKPEQKIYSWLNVAIALLVFVILTSAYQRLTLAIDWHGFSRLRLYPRVFLIWVGILFFVIVFLEIFHQERYFTFAFVLASMGFAISLTLVNVDAAIIKRNVFRVSQGKNLNVGHLASLSTDAVPALVKSYQSQGISDTTREGIGAVLLCYIHSGKVQIGQPVDWPSFNYSYWRAFQSLSVIKPLLTGYRVSGRGSSMRVRTPGNLLYECQGIY